MFTARIYLSQAFVYPYTVADTAQRMLNGLSDAVMFEVWEDRKHLLGDREPFIAQRLFSRACASHIKYAPLMLAEALRTHDWYYTYSDDGSVFRRGEARWDLIRFIVQRMFDAGLADEARNVWAEYGHKEFTMPAPKVVA